MAIKMKCPEGRNAVVFEGREYRADKKGVFELPEEAEITMYSFGLLTIGKNTAAKPEQPVEDKPKSDK